MASDADRNKAWRNERKKRAKDLPRIQRDTAAEVRRLLKRADRELRAQIAGGTGSDFERFLNPQLRASIRQTLEQIGTELGEAMVTGADKAWEAGIELVDSPIDKAARLEVPNFRIADELASVDLRQLGAMRTFLTTKMESVTLGQINRVNTQLGLAATGTITTSDAIAEVSKSLGSTRRRGITIVRTELGLPMPHKVIGALALRAFIHC